MEINKDYFKQVLEEVIAYSQNLGFVIHTDNNIDEFFKGDLDGLNIYLRKIDYEEDLFNILHMVGHSIQWSISDDLRALGNVIYKDPSKEVLKKLQNYEWEAICYGYKILVDLGYSKLKSWLEAKYVLDMLYLTHFYVTGEKLRVVNEETLKNAFKKPLIAKEIPKFKPVSQKNNRNGIVIDFNK